MFSKAALSFVVSVALMTASVISSPMPKNIAARGGHFQGGHDVSFNHWGGFDSLDNFDHFYGSQNFAHFDFEQTVVKQQELVCHTQAIEIIQQRLVVLQEMAKRIITEQICEVETQTVVFSQFHASLGGFSHDLRRNSGYHVGFDSHIADYYNQFFLDDGSLSSHDFGFSGTDVGQHTVVVGGSNWDDVQSPPSVNNAYFSAWNAYPHYF